MDAAAITTGLGQSLAHSDAHILIGVMVINMRVSSGSNLQVNQPMATDLVEHVIQERHTSRGRAASIAVEAKPDAHISFTGDAMDFTCAHGPLRPKRMISQF